MNKKILAIFILLFSTFSCGSKEEESKPLKTNEILSENKKEEIKEEKKGMTENAEKENLEVLDLEGLEKKLISSDYKAEKGSTGQREFTTYTLTNGEHTSSIFVYFEEGELNSFEIKASHYAFESNEEMIYQNLKKEFELIKPYIIDKTVLASCEKVFAKVKKENSEDTIITRDTIETLNYTISSYNQSDEQVIRYEKLR